MVLAALMEHTASGLPTSPHTLSVWPRASVSGVVMADQRRQHPRVSAVPGRWVPPPALTGFLVLLMAMFCLSYGIGSAVGPVAPGMRSGSGSGGGAGTGQRDGGGMDDMHS